MKSIITKTVVKLLIPLFLFFSFYMLFRGHNEPGGGFIGGLIGTIVFILYGMIYGSDDLKKIMLLEPLKLIFWGLAIIVASGFLSYFQSEPFMTSRWAHFYLPFFGKPGTPILFDIGIYILVMGVVLKITVTMLDQ
jgi:multicomponent Na+:H+ antiporter subunit B